MTPEERFAALGLELPPAPTPMGVYKPGLIEWGYLYLSGHGTLRPDGSMITGKVGQDLTADEAKLAAQTVGLSMIATIRATVGSLDRVHHVVKTLGMVWATPEFDRHPFVINGCSELFARIWGPDRGVGVRSAVGMGSLPGNIPVEIESLFKLEDA